MHLLEVQRQALGQSVGTVLGGCRKEKARQVAQEDTHGSESACTAERVHRLKGQKMNSSEEGKRKEIWVEGMASTCPGIDVLSSTRKSNTGCYRPGGLWLLLLLPTQIKGLCSGVQISLQGQVRVTQRWFLLLWGWSDAPAAFQPNLDCVVGTSVTRRRSHESYKMCTEVADLVLASSEDLTTDLNALGAKCKMLFIYLVPLQQFFQIQTSRGVAHPFNQHSRTVSILPLALGIYILFQPAAGSSTLVSGSGTVCHRRGKKKRSSPPPPFIFSIIWNKEFRFFQHHPNMSPLILGVLHRSQGLFKHMIVSV